MAEYMTRQGDVLDEIVWRFYGHTTRGIVERVMDANRHLTDHPPELPIGLRVVLPDASEVVAVQQPIRLWD